jgi:hypothetical protein
MKKNFFNIIFLVIIIGNAFGQSLTPMVIKSEIKFFENTKLKQQRNSTVEFLINKKSKRNEVKLTLNRIMRNVSLSHVENFDTDTVRYEGEGFTVDTDNPIPQGEHDKSLIENLVTFIDKTITLQEDASGNYIGPKVKSPTPNIESMFYSKMPALNKNNFLSPLILNFNPALNSKVDTVLSDSYQGIFITTYTKIGNEYDLNGRFIPLQTAKLESDPNIATTVYLFFNYNGKIRANAEKIEKLELDVHLKSRLIFKLIKLDEAREEKYKVIVENK